MDRIGEISTVALGAMSAILVIGIGLAWVEGQWGVISGRPGQLAGVLSKIAFLAVCGALVSGAGVLSSTLWGLLVSGKDSAAGLSSGIVRTGMAVVDVVLVAISALLTIGILTGAVAGQFLTELGAARGVSEAKTRIVGAIVMGGGGLLTIPIAHLVVAAVKGG